MRKHDAEFLAIIASILISGTGDTVEAALGKAKRLIEAAEAAAPEEKD